MRVIENLYVYTMLHVCECVCMCVSVCYMKHFEILLIDIVVRHEKEKKLATLPTLTLRDF